MKPNAWRLTSLLAMLALLVSAFGAEWTSSCAVDQMLDHNATRSGALHHTAPFHRVQGAFQVAGQGTGDSRPVPACPSQAALSSCSVATSLPAAEERGDVLTRLAREKWLARSGHLASQLTGSALFRPPRAGLFQSA